MIEISIMLLVGMPRRGRFAGPAADEFLMGEVEEPFLGFVGA